jgi:hypothetical protein
MNIIDLKADNRNNEVALPMLSLVIALLAIVATIFFAYHLIIIRPTIPRFAVVDIAEIYRAKEKEFSNTIADPNATDMDRKKAIDNAQRFAKDLQTLIDKLPKECGCIVLNKAAVMGSGVVLPDLTQEARKAVEL